MFSITAINDTDSKAPWEPLAPTKEAQEFHLSQTYHEGLLKLQAKEYGKARELLEAVLKDPLISTTQVDSSASDGHLLQLRFLTLKNLANVFLQQGSTHYESALNCYLQAVEIDSKDSVVWNQLGTLSCSMGLLSISRWAFEQGLFCSPNNWNCMEKLLEVLIAIRDEIACLSIAELILRHWPSHSRALHVKNTIQELDPAPFAPRGIDRLEPKHVRLKFPEKRKRMDSDPKEDCASKRLGKHVEIHLIEATWEALADSIMGILLPLRRKHLEVGTGIREDLDNGNLASGQPGDPVADTDAQNVCRDALQTPDSLNSTANRDRSGDIRLSIQLPSNSEICNELGQMAIQTAETVSTSEGGIEKISSVKEKEACICEEQPQERRSTRLRSRKPGKEELDFATSKDLAKVAVQVLEPFVVGRSKECDQASNECDQASSDALCPDSTNSSDIEHDEFKSFVMNVSKNYGAYHVGHLLLEDIARKNLSHQECFVKFLDLERMTRRWGQDRTIDCCLFLAELYYDFGLCSADESKKSVFLKEASYHLCKVIELVSLESPVDWNGVLNLDRDLSMTIYTSDNITSGGKCEGMSGIDTPVTAKCAEDRTDIVMSEQSASSELLSDNTILNTNSSFWVRFFWLSGCLSIFSGDKVKAYEEFCVSLTLLRKTKIVDGPPSSVLRPHCKFDRELTADRVLHEIYFLKVGFLLEKTLHELIEKEMYLDCVSLLAPLLLSTEKVYFNRLNGHSIDGDGVLSVELSALDILIKACEKAKPMDMEVYLKCHRRKLQVLLVASGMGEQKLAMQKSGSASEMMTIESTSQRWRHLVAEEVKAISRCASHVKNFMDQVPNSDVITTPVSIIGDIQALILTYMRNIISTFLCKKSSGSGTVDQTEEMESGFFLDAVVVFCKLHHLNQSIPVKRQVELIVAIHDLLAEYGLCCSGKDSEGEEGTFLKLAIKHLLVLDMKMKSSTCSSSKAMEAACCDEPLCHGSDARGLVSEPNLTEKDETLAARKDSLRNISEDIPAHGVVENDQTKDGKANNQVTEEEQIFDPEDKAEFGIDNALDQCFFCLYGLDLRSSDSSSDDDLAVHKNTSRGDYQTKEQCSDVFQYILPYAKASSRTELIKLRKVLRAIRKHFRHPPEHMLNDNSVDNFLDNLGLSEDKICEGDGSDGILEYVMSVIFPNGRSFKHHSVSDIDSSEPYSEVYGNLYYFLAQAEDTSTTDKKSGFVLTKEGEEFVEQNASLFKYDLLYNPLRFESWQQLANIYDEEVDLLLNDGSKHVNVAGWKKNPMLYQRVETSRRRSRRCLLMSLALAKTPAQQSEIHELLALVYYDGVQNVVPIYDQRSVSPVKDVLWTSFCQNSMKHFEKAFAHKPDWSHAFYLGKLFEKLGYPSEKAFSYYEKAITLNPTAVDPVYRLHASRLKLLSKCGKQNVEALKVIASYSLDQSTNASVMNIIDRSGSVTQELPNDVNETTLTMIKEDEIHHLEEAWNILYSECLTALEVCVEGELKHFHKARYMLAQGWYRKGSVGCLERAKEELSFCFKSTRSSFTINMWEIDSTVKKGRRKTPGPAGNKKALEVNLAESSRKFITCIRKYTLFYLKLLLESGDISMLDRAYTSLRGDKRFSLCLEDVVPVSLGRLILAITSSIHQVESLGKNIPQHLLERMFNLFLDQASLWMDISSLPEIKNPDLSESSFYGYLHHYIHSLERDLRLDTLEGINEKMRKRFKNPKLSNNNCSKVCKHASVAWCRSLLINLALLTPLNSEDVQAPNLVSDSIENTPLLCVAVRWNDLWNSSFEDPTNLKGLESKWSSTLSKLNGIVIKQALEDKMEIANTLLRSSFNFYRETSCGSLPSGIDLYTVPSSLAQQSSSLLGLDGAEIIDLSVPRKLLLWAYTLVHGRYTNILTVVKHCEETIKSKTKKGTPIVSVSSHTSTATQSGGAKDRASQNECVEAEIDTSPMSDSNGTRISPLVACSSGTQKSISGTHDGGDNSR
ncbi:hypothetical protein ACHQM5_028819 [Ranunculus cassubicifolius]